MVTTKVLEMIFDTEMGDSFTIGVDSPTDDLSGETVKVAMGEIIANDIFQYKEGKLTGIKNARLVSRTVEDLL